jgi:serine/threonine protein kinase
MLRAHCPAQVLRLLGTGGEGETWLCVDQRNKQEVAIKLVRRPIPRSITQIIQVHAAGLTTRLNGAGAADRRVHNCAGLGAD